MNNIYVEGEFSNHCNDCPFYNIETEVEFVGYEKNYHKCLVGGDIITGNCPLKPLSDRLAEERKKVCEQIYQLFTNGRMWSTMKDWWLNNGTCIELKQVLDAVETETPNQEIIKKFSKDREYYALLEQFKKSEN